ncbi:MAG: 50S ribosomal protein L18e [Candidatus Bathyarchaeota archaeon]|nr:MAG: 50S ribosomal protein L18e [Candidatus Bathyarchaeota archaeon]
MRKLRAKNPQLLDLIRTLRKTARENDAKIWSAIAENLAKARCRRVSVNLSRINRHAAKGQTVAVPGKVLGSGTLDHPVTIAAFSFSAAAAAKIKKSKGRCMTFGELMRKNPKGSNVKIVG